MIDLEENSTKFLLMFMVANDHRLESAIQTHKQILKMEKGSQIQEYTDQHNANQFDYTEIKKRLKKHIPMLSDEQFDHAVNMCKQQSKKINSRSDLVQCIIDHL